MSVHLLPTALLVGSLALAGCIQPAAAPAAEVFVVEYKIVDLDRSDGVDLAEAGHHCGDASRDGDTLTVWLWPEEERPDGPWLAVFAELPEDWHSGMGGEPFKTTFPHKVDPNVQDDDTTLGRLTWEPQGNNGTMRLDGEPIALPHAWSVAGEGGAWRADLVLRAWTGTVKVDRYQAFCD